MIDPDNVDDLMPKSKSQVKREMTELQKLGEKLVALSTEQLRKADLPDELHAAIMAAKKITSHGAKRRQLQFIGRLMRDLENPERIRDYISEIENKHQRANAYFHLLESWRERLIADEPGTLTEFFTQYPQAERQYLRQLITQAKKEKLSGHSTHAAKLLFRYLKELQTQNKEHD